MRWKRPETARRAYIRLLSERAGIQESAAPEDRDSALYSELIDAGYLRGVPFRDAAKGGMTTGVTVTEITLKGRLFLQQLKSEERRQSFLGRLKNPADKTFESTPVIMYVRSTDKAQLHVNNIEELNKFDLRGIQEHHPNAESKKVGSARLSDGKEIPIYSFSGGGYFERVAYAEQSKTITVFVASAEKKDDLKSSEKAFRELVASYLFISDNVTTPNHP